MDQQKALVALRGKDPGAVQELVSSYGDRLLRSAFLLCGNPTEAEDIVQDTFVQAMRSVHRFQSRSSIYTWLHSILLHLTRHYHRNRQRLIYDEELVNREMAEPSEAPSGLDIETTTAALSAALRQLSGPHREVLILRYYENMKIQEVAAHLRISKGTVKSRLHYAVAEMQRIMPNALNLFGTGGTKETART